MTDSGFLKFTTFDDEGISGALDVMITHASFVEMSEMNTNACERSCLIKMSIVTCT